MIGVFEDLRFSLRALAKARIFAIAAVLSLALGIGAMVLGILFKSLNVSFLVGWAFTYWMYKKAATVKGF